MSELRSGLRSMSSLLGYCGIVSVERSVDSFNKYSSIFDHCLIKRLAGLLTAEAGRLCLSLTDASTGLDAAMQMEYFDAQEPRKESAHTDFDGPEQRYGPTGGRTGRRVTAKQYER